MDIISTMKKFSTQESCIEFLEKVRWPNGPVCPYCNNKQSSKKKLRYTCRGFNRSYSVTVGTVMESSRLPLPKWFLAVSIILSAKKGISSRQLARHLKINKDTALYLQQRIRAAISEGDNQMRGIMSYIKEKRKIQRTSPNQFKIRNWITGGMYNPSHYGLFHRSLIGSYHRLSLKYMQLYLNELDFKYNHRKRIDMGMSELLKRLTNKYLPLSRSYSSTIDEPCHGKSPLLLHNTLISTEHH